MPKWSKKKKRPLPDNLYNHAEAHECCVVARTEEVNMRKRKVTQLAVQSHTCPSSSHEDAEHENFQYDGITFEPSGDGLAFDSAEEMEGLIVRTTDKAKRYLNSISALCISNEPSSLIDTMVLSRMRRCSHGLITARNTSTSSYVSKVAGSIQQARMYNALTARSWMAYIGVLRSVWAASSCAGLVAAHGMRDCHSIELK